MKIGTIIYIVTNEDRKVQKHVVVECEDKRPIKSVRLDENDKAFNEITDVEQYRYFETKKEAYIYVKKMLEFEKDAKVHDMDKRIKKLEAYIDTLN